MDIKKFKRAQCWLPVGLHSWFVDFDKLNLEDLYNMFKEKVDQGVCTGFAHIERDWYKFGKEYDELTPEVKKMFERIVLLASENNIPLELNETSFVLNFHTLQNNYIIG